MTHRLSQTLTSSRLLQNKLFDCQDYFINTAAVVLTITA